MLQDENLWLNMKLGNDELKQSAKEDEKAQMRLSLHSLFVLDWSNSNYVKGALINIPPWL